MNPILDEYIIALSAWEYVGYLRALYLFLFVVAFLGFLYYWILAVGVWTSAIKEAWPVRFRGLLWLSDPRNPRLQKFLSTMLKGVLVWLIAGWPLVLMMMGLASEEALNALWGKEAIAGV
ncbi:MAG: hypothetical protein AAF299_09200 [Pseudomonadota bacterium]